jgi:hypothetical protein
MVKNHDELFRLISCCTERSPPSRPGRTAPTWHAALLPPEKARHVSCALAFWKPGPFYGTDTDRLCIVLDTPISDRRGALLEHLGVSLVVIDVEGSPDRLDSLPNNGSVTNRYSKSRAMATRH